MFFFGFPFTPITVRERNYPIVRSGVIALKAEEKCVKNNAGKWLHESVFLIDAMSFPGNSGSPVVLTPTDDIMVGEEPRKRHYLIGIITGHIPFGKDNPALAIAFPVESIREVIQQF